MNNPPKPTSVFWIEVDKIKPNPMQPRREFKEEQLRDLAESIRQYGVLQPLVVSRKEIETDAGTRVEYELIAGERRLRASKIAGLFHVPVIIRDDASDKLKLELAIIENLQREDLNPLDRAFAFDKLINEFALKHQDVADRVGKSRVFVTNTLRLLTLPQEIKDALVRGDLYEGHCRPLLMLSERPDEQMVLFREIVLTKMPVREAEKISRRIAQERARNKTDLPNPETRNWENRLSDMFGTRVMIERTGDRGRISIDFFSEEELKALLDKVIKTGETKEGEFIAADIAEGAAHPPESAHPEETEELIDKFTV